MAVTDTEIGDVRGLEGFYHYRQYSATELARHRSLEDVWQLLLRRLPSRRRGRAAHASRPRSARPAPSRLHLLDALPGHRRASPRPPAR